MINTTKSSPKKDLKLIDFDFLLDPIIVSTNFKNETIKKETYFVHIENIYQSLDDDLIVKVSFGSSQNHEHKYIIITGEMTRFINEKVLPTESNIKSFAILKEIIKNY